MTTRDYYETSAPPPRSSTETTPWSRMDWLPTSTDPTATAVPTFTRSSIGQGGTQLYSDSIATATP